jgi:undecaprenyl diphosphate synthase
MNLLIDFERLPAQVRATVAELERATSKCTGFLLNLCLSYGGRAEIVSACRNIAKEVQQSTLDIAEIDENTFQSYLSTKNIKGESCESACQRLVESYCRKIVHEFIR